MTWQPIETAPLDGTRVLLFREEFAEAMAVAWWNAGTSDWIPVNGVLFVGPTAWMPLPQPPKEE